MRSAWVRLPLVVRAVLTGLVVTSACTLPWAALVSLNTRHWSSWPWAVPPALLYLWAYWKYVRGAGWPRSTSSSRRAACRARPLPDDVWGAALVAGVLGLVSLVLLLGIVNRMVRLPVQPTGDLSRIPVATLMAWLVTGSLVAGLAEESGFRGYMQRPIEQRHGPIVAILVTGTAFGLAHFTHPEVTVLLLPYYLAVAAVYGGLAYFTDSILPSAVLHAGGNILGGLDLLTRGRAEWQAGSRPVPLLWETGPDASFWLSCAALLVACAATAWAYSALAAMRARHGTRESGIGNQDSGAVAP